MTHELDLLAAINEVPDDDAPRLTYATFVENREPAYAEFIHLQIERSRHERERHEYVGNPSARELALLRSHYNKWGHYIERYMRDAPVQREDDQGWQFDRGFIAFARMEPENFIALGQRLFDMAPIQHAELYGGTGPIRPLFDSPYLARLDSLSLWRAGLTDDDAVALANCEALRRATWIDLSDNHIGQAGMEALAASPIFENKVVVRLAGNPFDPTRRPSWDWDGSLASSYLPEEGVLIEEKVGRRVPWLHYVQLSPIPDRYHAKWFVDSDGLATGISAGTNDR